MYQLMIYFLGTLLVALTILSYLKILPYDPADIIASTVILCISSVVVNAVVAKISRAYTNVESALITGQILSLIVGPLGVQGNSFFLVSVAGISIVSKYVLAINKRHVFNPAGLGILAGALLFGRGASWWVGSVEIIGLVAAGSILIFTKLKRFTLALVFLSAYLLPATMLGIDPITILLYTPILFFASVMLIEPLTSPVKTKQQIAYAAFMGILLLALQMSLKVPYTLELGLLVANLFSYLMGKPLRVEMTLKSREKIAKNTFAFHFLPAEKFAFEPGQYMSWTLPHKGQDKRGVRRYFTISSSPRDTEVVVSLKLPEGRASSYKQSLMKMRLGDKIIANDPVGEFVLPNDHNLPLAFVAGGIGVTPFISMAKWLIEKNETRDIVLLYANSREEDIAYSQVLARAKKQGLKTINIVTKRDGHIDQAMIAAKIPDYKARMFYVSGPQAMVDEVQKLLRRAGVKKIKTDFFPGYAKGD